VAGAENIAPLTGLLRFTTGGAFELVVPDILTLVITEVTVVIVLWLVTASPTYTVSAIGIVSEPTAFHDTPSADR